VAGPRLALAPTDVVAVRPPAGSQGGYDTWLPHVLLAQRSLPWQVAISDQPPTPPTPWLALLLLTRAEIDVQGSPPAAGTTGIQTVTIADYLTPPSGTLGPQITAGLTNAAQEQPQMTCTIVDVDFETFRAVAPETMELPFLANVRYIDASDQETLDAPYPGWYSLVIGNRLPVGAPDATYIAHLVSVEGFAEQLPDQPGANGYNLVRLVSLTSWTFSCIEDPGDFTALMQKLDVSPFTVPITGIDTDPSSQLVADAAAEGYAMLNYTSRLGEQTVAWYRGPLQPAPVAANPQPPYPSAAAALIYDTATGMFDTSYAAAWEIGRLLTLANGPVATSLATWIATATNANQQLVEAARTSERTVQPSTIEPHGRRGAAQHLIVGRVIPALVGDDNHRPVLAPSADPSGLAGRDMPSLLDHDMLNHLLAISADPYGDIRDHALAAARGDNASPASVQEPAPRSDQQ
jgi:hypothetical protein